jgi:hypothetical protein
MEITPEGTSRLGDFRKALVADFEQRIDEWCHCRKLLFEWENEHLLENPSPEKPEQMRFGLMPVCSSLIEKKTLAWSLFGMPFYAVTRKG